MLDQINFELLNFGLLIILAIKLQYMHKTVNHIYEGVDLACKALAKLVFPEDHDD